MVPPGSARTERLRRRCASRGRNVSNEPAGKPGDGARNLLVLDLDGTLVHADYECFQGFEFVLDADTREPIYLRRRPHIEEFLDRVAAAYDLAVWTASSEDYGRKVLRHTTLDRRVVRALFGDRCTRRFDLELQTWRTIKRLRKVGRNLARVLIVENSPEKCEDNYGNCVPVTTYEGGDEDGELLPLAKYLVRIRDAPNFRAIEKRFWRTVVERLQGP